MPEKKVLVVNRSGNTSPFSADRLIGTLVRTGVKSTEAVPIADAVERYLIKRTISEIATDDLRYLVAELSGAVVSDLAVDHLMGNLGTRAVVLANPGFVTSGIFRWTGPAPHACKANQFRKQVVYSRGNNDLDQSLQQHAATGAYQYQTGLFEITLDANPAGCTCGGGGHCAGTIALALSVKYTASHAWPSDPVNMNVSLQEGPTPPAATQGTPATGMTVTLGARNLPANPPVPKNAFRQPDPARREFIAEVDSTMACSAGSVHKRFHLNVPAYPALQCFVDCSLEVTAPAQCELNIAGQVFFFEFGEGFDFSHGGLAPGNATELPEITHHRPGGGSGQTRNIAKEISVDGAGTGTAFPARHPSVTNP